MICMLIIFTLCTLTVESRTNRENNVYNSLKRATDDAIESVLEEKTYSIRSNEQFVAAVTEMLCNSLVSQNEIMKCSCGYEGRPSANEGTEVNAEFAMQSKILRCPNCGTTQIADPTSSDPTKRKGISPDLTVKDEKLKLTIEVVEADFRRGLLSLNIVEEYTNPMGAIGTCEYATTVIFDEAKIHDTYAINYYDVTGILIESYIVRAGDVWPQPSVDIRNKYKITKWGSLLGGGGETFIVPSNVPADSEVNNITKYIQYDAATGSVNLYGNYQP